MTKLPSLQFGPVQLNDSVIGIFDGLPPEMNIGGIISLQTLQHHPFTYDYPNNRIVFENNETLAKRVQEGVVVPVRLDYDGPSVGIYMHMTLPDGSSIEVEVDTGSGSLILNDRYRSNLKVLGGLSSLKRVEGKDETGHHFIRYFGKLAGTIHPQGAEAITQTEPPVQFQKIIYDGLVGDAFLSHNVVTYDLPHSRLIFKK